LSTTLKLDPLATVENGPPPETLDRVEPGRNGVLSVEDWAEIRRLHGAEGLPIKQIARVLGVSKNTVRAASSRQS
jgi:DNA-binding transcriptional regulator YiaG